MKAHSHLLTYLKKGSRINHIFFSIATYGEGGNRIERGLG